MTWCFNLILILVEFMKLFIKSLFFLSISSFLFGKALAKTEGFNIGLSFDRFNANNELILTRGFSSYNGIENKFNIYSSGLGVDFKYYVNYDNFFLSPSIFFDYINNEARKTSDIDNVEFKNRYGIKTEFGYNLIDDFSIYGVIGYAGISYDHSILRYVSGDTGLILINKHISDRDYSMIYGVGFLYSLNDKVSFDLELNRQNVDPNLTSSMGYDRIHTRLDNFSFGILYNF